MKLSRIYEKAVKFGAELDPRGKTAVKSFSDTAILYGDLDTEVKSALVGIDIEVGELLLADRIRQTKRLDLTISHHPEGKAYAALYDVMPLQIDLLVRAGIPKIVARELLEERKREIERKILPQNHMRSVDVARLLNLPFMCMHTPADNHASSFIQELMAEQRPKKVQDIIGILMGIPEYKQAAKDSAAPRIILGAPNRSVGKVFVEMTGGTEGSSEAFDKLYKAGVRTLISMHLSEEHFRKVKDAKLNVVIAGHISSDTLGLNLLLDRIEKEEQLQVINCSGFRRFRRG